MEVILELLLLSLLQYLLLRRSAFVGQLPAPKNVGLPYTQEFLENTLRTYFKFYRATYVLNAAHNYQNWSAAAVVHILFPYPLIMILILINTDMRIVGRLA